MPRAFIYPQASITIDGVENVQDQLDAKADLVHTHTASQISNSTAVGRALVTAADADAALTTLGLSGATFSGDYNELTNRPTLGTSAALDVGTVAGTVAGGDDYRLTGAAQKTSNLSDLSNATTARTNLGLGDSATRDVGTALGDVAAGAHASQHESGGDDELTLATSQVTGLHGLLGNTVIITDASASRVHPDNGAALAAGIHVIWICATQPAALGNEDVWLQPDSTASSTYTKVGEVEYAASSSSTTHNFDLPASIADGDFIVFAGAYAHATDTCALSGITGITEYQKNSTTGLTSYVWVKENAASGDSSDTITATCSGAQWFVGGAVVFRGAPTSSVMDTYAVSNGTTGISRTSGTLTSGARGIELQMCASATPVAGTSTTDVSATKDSYVQSTAATTNYNAATYLSVRSGSPVQIAYVGYTLPASGGSTLTGARLRIRTSTDVASGSVAAQDVHLATGSWEEATVTYDTRPTASTYLGQLAGGSTADTAYEITLDETVIEPLLGTAITIQISSAGTADGFIIWGKDYAASGSRPVLELDFEAPASLSEPTPPTGMTCPVSIATPGAAGVSSAAIALGYFALTSTNSGTSMGGDAWAVDDSASAAWTLSAKVS